MATYINIPPVSGGDAWYDAQVAGMKTLIPALAATTARFEYIKPGQNPVGATISAVGVDAPIEGGGLGVASDTTFVQFSTTVWQNPRTSVGAVAFRAKFPAITAAKTCEWAVTTPGNVDAFGFGHAQAVSASKWVLFVRNGANVISGTNADTSIHDFIIGWDGSANITVQVDGTTVATSAQLAVVPTNPVCMGCFSSATLTPGVLTTRIAYGCIPA